VKILKITMFKNKNNKKEKKMTTNYRHEETNKALKKINDKEKISSLIEIAELMTKRLRKIEKDVLRKNAELENRILKLEKGGK
jgi:hypothetical protein